MATESEGPREEKKRKKSSAERKAKRAKTSHDIEDIVIYQDEQSEYKGRGNLETTEEVEKLSTGKTTDLNTAGGKSGKKRRGKKKKKNEEALIENTSGGQLIEENSREAKKSKEQSGEGEIQSAKDVNKPKKSRRRKKHRSSLPAEEISEDGHDLSVTEIVSRAIDMPQTEGKEVEQASQAKKKKKKRYSIKLEDPDGNTEDSHRTVSVKSYNANRAPNSGVTKTVEEPDNLSIEPAKISRKRRRRKSTGVTSDSVKEESRKKTDSILKSIQAEENGVKKNQMALYISGDEEEMIDVRRGVKQRSWETSEPVGGVFVNSEPILTPDEKHIILANKHALQVYSLSTSLLQHAIPALKDSTITSYALSIINPSHIYVALQAGNDSSIVLWDWEHGLKLGRWILGPQVLSIVVSKDEGKQVETIYTLERSMLPDRSPFQISAHRLHRGREAPKTALALVHKSQERLISFQVSVDGQTIVVATKEAVRIGTLERQKEGPLQGLHYNWREISTPHSIVCFHARFLGSSKEEQDAKSKKTPATRGQLDVVVGSVYGALYIYEDVLAKLVKIETKENHDIANIETQPRILHWHREAVGATKWSLDGNYILSGGRETVLCIWQLQTGKRQHLPHLPAAIEDVVVSPKGSSYALRLADNSVVVLSTTELKPKASIAGIQTQNVDLSADTSRSLLETANGKGQANNPYDGIRQTPAVLHPTRANHMLLGVPSSVSRTEVNTSHLSTPYLQTYDYVQARHVARQALSRNNATTFFNSPSSIRIQEPDVRFLQISYDGKWLATVEEWTPPRSDIKILSSDDDGVNEERSQRLESYLKFWSWNENLQGGVWQLETRIDSPHLFPDGLTPGRVFGLTAEPNRHGFATIGEDGSVRQWKPKTRLRDGMVVRGASGDGLVTWSTRFSVELDSYPLPSEHESDFPSVPRPTHGCISYSEDGSLLVASLARPGNVVAPVVHFIDSNTGEVKETKAGLYDSGLIAMGIMDRCLIILSDSLNVWDIVANEHVYGFVIQKPDARLAPLRTEVNHLAINHSEKNFAIIIAAKQKRRLPVSKIAVFKPDVAEPIWISQIANLVTAFLAVPGAKGFAALACTAEIYLVGPSGGTLPLPSITSAVAAQQASSAALTTGAEDDVSMEDAAVEGETNATATPLVPQTDDDEAAGLESIETENDRPVVRPQQLARVFDTLPGFALPPVKQLFDAVVRLYARRPRATG